jgi:hypothetical protein
MDSAAMTKITDLKMVDLRRLGKANPTHSAKRAFSIYACKTYSGATYKSLAEYFNLSHVGSVCYPLARIKKEIAGGGWGKEIKEIENEFFIVKYT